MTALVQFTGRNIKNYFRDIRGVIFSFLSTLVLIVLMVGFLGGMYSEDLADAIISCCPQLDADTIRDNCDAYVTLCTLGGVLLLNCISINMAVIASVIHDESEKKLAVFYATSVNRSILAVGYILSAWLITSLIGVATLACSELLLAVLGYDLLTFVQLAKLAGLLLLLSFTFSCLSYVLVPVFRTNAAWGAISAVSGPIIGFAAGCYVPISMFSDRMQNILHYLPFLHGGAALRCFCLEKLLDTGFEGVPSEIMREIGLEMGNILEMEGHSFTLAEQLLMFAGWSAVLLGLSVLITWKRRSKTL